MGKKELQSIFSSNPEKYYEVSLFNNVGFKRYSCNICDRYYWSINEKLTCPEHEQYGFIGRSPSSKKIGYVDTWKLISEYFKNKNHHIIGRYPVVCRWREDLYYTIASIVNFQRIMGNNVIFELPYNPLVVPQICLRFNDIDNVGVSGRHYTSFCMVGQVCNSDSIGGYWKDECIELDYNMLTAVLGIPKEEIIFMEDVWLGAGAFGYSLEYYVRGLELGNAVFTEFEGNEKQYKTMPNRIIDMGAGLERLTWITNGTPTSYDCCFGPIINSIVNITSIDTNTDILTKYFTSISSKIDVYSDYRKLKNDILSELSIDRDKLLGIILPYEAIYTIADHTRTLLFSISDGSLPSNVGGGYNLRVLLRRILSLIERYGWNLRLEEICDLHIDYLKDIFPELQEHREDVREILYIESKRYKESRKRMIDIAQSMKKKTNSLDVSDLIRLYESDGITPDLLVETGVMETVPSLFYTKLAELHAQGKAVSNASVSMVDINRLPPTRLLYYENSLMRTFEAIVIKVIDKKYVILDKTAFYPRGGGQEPDKGVIDNFKVIEVIKQGDTVIHVLEKEFDILEGRNVTAIVDDNRRNRITKHHTATHILNAASREILGSWVWQNSAFKDEDYGRLDITHHSSLQRDELNAIENRANEIVRENVPLSINFYDRNYAEQTFTFRIYQGGVAPSAKVRVVKIQNFDVEACGGTHVIRTGDIGLIKITKSERIQDGVIRLEFVAGEAALHHIQRQDSQIHDIITTLSTSKDKVVDSVIKNTNDLEYSKRKVKSIVRKVSETVARQIIADAKKVSNGIKFYVICDDELDSEYYITIGEKVVKLDSNLVFVAILYQGSRIHTLVFCGENAVALNKHAKEIAKIISQTIGGSGGGTNYFGQGGGRYKDKINDALISVEELLEKE